MDVSTLLSTYPLIPIILIGLCVFGLSLIWIDRILALLYDKSLGSRQYVLDRMRLMLIETDESKVTKTMLLMSFGLGSIVFFLFWPNLFAGIFFGSIITAVGWQVPKYLVDMAFEKRAKLFVSQMVDALTILANGLSAGKSITLAMENVVENMPNPISQEFKRVLNEIGLGSTLSDALIELSKRIPEADVQMFVVAVNILEETGGSLNETFTTIVDTIRERQKILQKVDALTTQGKTQGAIMSVIPLLLLMMFYVFMPDLIMPLFNTTIGWIVLFIMLIMQIMGGVVIRKIVTIKV